MSAAVVVLIDEGIDEGLELGDPGGLVGLLAEPFLHGLLEAFDLAAGGGVGWSGVLLDHVQLPEFALEGVASVASAGKSCRVDHAVIGQGGGRDAVLTCGFAEGSGDDRPGDPGVGAHVQGVADAVVVPPIGVSISNATKTEGVDGWGRARGGSVDCRDCLHGEVDLSAKGRLAGAFGGRLENYRFR